MLLYELQEQAQGLKPDKGDEDIADAAKGYNTLRGKGTGKRKKADPPKEKDRVLAAVKVHTHALLILPYSIVTYVDLLIDKKLPQGGNAWRRIVGEAAPRKGDRDHVSIRPGET